MKFHWKIFLKDHYHSKRTDKMKCIVLYNYTQQLITKPHHPFNDLQECENKKQCVNQECTNVLQFHTVSI